MNEAQGLRQKLVPLTVFVMIAVWRLASQPLKSLWQDWVLLLALYGIYTLFRRSSRAWPLVTASVMAFLLGIYIHGQLPYSLSVFGLAK